MKLLVTVKRVIDYNVQIRVKADGSGVEKENVKMSMNPPDENAVEEALRIKEAGKADEIIILSIGNDKAQETIRTALAMGADRGIHIKTDIDLEPLAISKIISKIAGEEKKPVLSMELKYHSGNPVISNFERVSKPGRRIFSSADSLPKINNGLGIAIVSTPKGVMTDMDARKQKIGGEIICKVF